jgi:bacteriocin-like protein
MAALRNGRAVEAAPQLAGKPAQTLPKEITMQKINGFTELTETELFQVEGGGWMDTMLQVMQVIQLVVSSLMQQLASAFDWGMGLANQITDMFK